MMKSFFKKLAFVMALAMVVSLAAPAATTASAAEDKKPLAIAYQKGAAITALNLVEVGDTEDLRFVYAPANWKDLEVEWKSSNPEVVSVDASGVVKAEAAGTATVTVTVGDETASIEVYSVDTTTFVATMGTADNRAMTELELTVGDEFDFAFYGIKDYSVDYYRCDWFAVDPDGVLEFDDTNGKLVAKKAGSAKISLGVMNLITGIKTDVAPCTVTVKEVAPEVDPNNFEVTKMLSDSAFELTFENVDITAEEIQKNLSVYYYVGTRRIQYNYPRTVEVKDGVASVAFHALLTDGTTYGFVYNGVEKETTVKIGEPASIYVSWQDKGGTDHWNCAYAGYTTQLYATILNAEGADITASVLNTAEGKYVEYYLADTSVAAQYYMQGADQIYFTAPNTTALVVAKLYYGFDNLGQRIESVQSVPTAITSTVRPQRTFAFQDVYNATVNGYRTWNGTTSAKNWWDNVTKLAVGDQNKYFALELVDNYNNWVKIENGYMTYDSELGLGIYDQNTGLGNANIYSRYVGQFTFASDNIGIFTIDPNTGRMIANKAGQANVLVYYDPDMYNTTTADKVLVAVVPVTTYGKRAATSFSVDANYKTVSTYAGDGNYNEVWFRLTVLDQLGEKFDAGLGNIAAYNKSVATAGVTFPVISAVTQAEPGVYDVKITCTDSNVGAVGASRALYYGFSYKNSEKVTFTANVVRPDLTKQAGAYAFDTWTTDWHKDVNPYWYGADHNLGAGLYVYKNGVKVAKEAVSLMTWGLWTNPANASFDTVYVKVLKNGVDVTEKYIGNDDAVAAVTKNYNEINVKLAATGIATSDGYAIVDNELGAGSYTVLAYKAVTYAGTNSASPVAMQLVASSTVDVADSKMAVSYVGKITDDTYLTGINTVDKNAMAMASFAVKIGDHTCRADWNSWGSVKVHANTVTYNDNTTYFESLEIYVPVDGIWGTSNTYVRYEVKVGDYVITR